jgi:hypothetical protein
VQCGQHAGRTHSRNRHILRNGQAGIATRDESFSAPITAVEIPWSIFVFGIKWNFLTPPFSVETMSSLSGHTLSSVRMVFFQSTSAAAAAAAVHSLVTRVYLMSTLSPSVYCMAAEREKGKRE